MHRHLHLQHLRVHPKVHGRPAEGPSEWVQVPQPGAVQGPLPVAAATDASVAAASAAVAAAVAASSSLPTVAACVAASAAVSAAAAALPPALPTAAADASRSDAARLWTCVRL